jgi:hypothetical protein
MHFMTAWLHAGVLMVSLPRLSPSEPTPSQAPTPARPGKEPLQIRIPTTVKRRFKSRAAILGKEPHELFVEIFEFYEAHHPHTAVQPGVRHDQA